MNSDNRNTSLLRRASRYAIAVGAVALSSLLRYGMDMWVGSGLPTFITFYPAVMVAALLGGFGPGLIATVLAALVADYLVILPAGFGIAIFRDAVGIGLFFSMGVFMSTVAELYRRTRFKAAAYDQEVALRETRQEKEFLADILQSSNQPFAVGYQDGRLGLVNNAFEQLTGYNGDELISLDWAKSLTPPEWWDIEQKKLEDLRRTGQPVRYEKEYIRKDDTRVPIELLVHLMTASDGKAQYYYSFLTDITERKQSEQALQQQRRELQMILDSMPAMVFYKDTENRFIRTNRALEDAMGLSKDDLEGKSIFDLYPKEQAEAYWKDDNEVLATGKAKTNIIEPMETPQGTRLVETSKIPYLDEQGTMSGVIGFALDITERKQAEQALRQSEERLRLAQQVAKIGAFEWNVQTGVNVWSPEIEAMYGLARGEFGGTQFAWEQLVHPEDRAAAVGLVNQTFETGEPVEGEWRVVWRDGSVHWIVGRFQLLKDAAGTPLRLSGVNLEITERKQAEEALKESQEDLNRAQAVAQIGSWRLNVQRNELQWSAENWRIFGLPRGTPLTYETFLGTVHPQDREYVNRKWQAALCGEHYDIEHRIIADGAVKWVRERAELEFDQQGVLLGGFGTTQDITERKEMEESLRQSHDELELRVQERTAMLNKVNELLRAEIAERQKTTEEIQDLYNNAPCGYHSLDPEGTFVRINNTELSWLRYSRDEIIGKKKFSDLLTASSVDFFKKSFPLFKERGIVHDLEFDMIRKDGRILPVVVSATAILDEQGKYVMSRSSVFDITERRRAAETLRESEERFRLLIHTAPVVIVSLAPDGTILEFNPEAELAYGRTRAEVLGMNYPDLFIPVEQHAMVADAMKKVLAGETISSYENSIRNTDGSEYFYIWNIDRVLDDTGNPSAIIAVGHDVSERRKMLEALEAAAAYTRSLIEASLDPLVTINRDGKVTDLNKATEQIVNLPREQIIGTDFSDYFTESEKARRVYQHVFKRGFVRNYPLAIKGRFGVVRDVLYNATVYRNHAGEIDGVLAAARDISKRKRAETRLRESEERLKFLSTRLLEVQEQERKSIATDLHDSIASSLTAVILSLSRVRPAIEACDPKYRDIFTGSISMLQNAIDETRQLMNSLRPPMLDDFGLISSIRWFIEQYRALYPRLTTETEITVEECMIPAHLRIVLFRIIQEAFTNIAKHSRAQTATLYLKQRENAIDLVIADTGAGFDSEAVNSNQELNRGLGIMSMKERAELSGGILSINSDKGQGTIISASWPLQQ